MLRLSLKAAVIVASAAVLAGPVAAQEVKPHYSAPLTLDKPTYNPGKTTSPMSLPGGKVKVDHGSCPITVSSDENCKDTKKKYEATDNCDKKYECTVYEKRGTETNNTTLSGCMRGGYKYSSACNVK